MQHTIRHGELTDVNVSSSLGLHVGEQVKYDVDVAEVLYYKLLLESHETLTYRQQNVEFSGAYQKRLLASSCVRLSARWTCSREISSWGVLI